MKKLSIAFLLFCLFTVQVSAQVTTPVKIRAENFPIGGMDISGVWADRNAVVPWMSVLGFNTYFLQDYYGGKFQIAGHLPPGMTMYAGTANYHDGNLLYTSYCGAKGVYPSTEHRFFLATTPDQTVNTAYGIKSDYERIDILNKITGSSSVWKNDVKGGPSPFPTNRATLPAEWIIPASATGELLHLELQSVGEGKDEANLPVWNNAGLREFHVNNNTLLVDFIFKFDGDLSTQPESLYTVTAKVFASAYDDITDDTKVISIMTLHLTKTLYAANKDFVTHANSNKDASNPDKIDYNNPKSLFNFPNPLATSQTQYAVARMDPLGTNPIDINGKHKVVFTLTRDGGTEPIYVRGFRIRTKMCDDILANQSVPDPTISGTPSIHMDDQIKNDFLAKLVAELHPDNTTESNMMWDRTSNIVGPNEPTRECFRVYTYIDHLFSNYMNKMPSYHPKKMNMYGFLTENVSNAYAEYRAIYQDEMGQTIPPPCIVAEGTFSTYSKEKNLGGNPPFVPRDAIPNNIRNTSGFTDMGFTVRPFLPSNSLYPESLLSGYSAYLRLPRRRPRL